MAGAIRDIGELLPGAQAACREFLRRCEDRGFKVCITETYRSQERQNELFAQGRTAPGRVVTWTKKSRHTSRRAWDICQNVRGKEYSDREFFEGCGRVAAELGITWGGNWKTPDMPHFEVAADWRPPVDLEKEVAMTTEERKEFEELKKSVEQLLDGRERVYHYWNELPDWARPTVEKLVNSGIYHGASEADLNLPEGLLRMMVILDRCGSFDCGDI